jgi:hypothetical protein
MQHPIITINEIDYSLRFGYGALRALGEVWNVAGPVQVGEKISDSFAGFDGGDLTYEQIDVIAAMVLSAIIAQDATVKKRLDIDEVAQAMMAQPEAMAEVLTAYMAAMPQPKGNPQPATKKKQTKKKK